MQRMPDRELSKPATDLALEQLADSRVFFAHQSVGDNLLNGVASLQSNTGPRLRLVDLKKESHGADDLRAVFAHARLGQNGDARGKTAAFVSAVEAGIGRTFDIVFQKYCFVDIDASTNVTAVFDNYRQSM